MIKCTYEKFKNKPVHISSLCGMCGENLGCGTKFVKTLRKMDGKGSEIIAGCVVKLQSGMRLLQDVG